MLAGPHLWGPPEQHKGARLVTHWVSVLFVLLLLIQFLSFLSVFLFLEKEYMDP